MANSTLALTKTTRDGRTATVTIETDRYGHLMTVAHLDGEEVGNHTGPHHNAPNMPPGAVAAVGRLLLTADEAAQVKAAWDQAKAARPIDLSEQRRKLAAKVRSLEIAEVEEPAIRMDEGDPLPYRDLPAIEARLNKARADLAEFDAAHPEIAAAMKAERDARVARFIEAGQ